MMGFITVFSGLSSQKSIAQENSNASIVVQNQNDNSVNDGLIKKVKSTWPWYVARASGLVAAGTLIVLMLSGIGMITGHTFKILEPITAWATHRALGIAFGVSTVTHIAVLYFDNFVPFDIKSLLVPFVSQYKTAKLFGVPIGSFYVASGIVSLYIIAAIILTSLFWINKRSFIWKVTHVLSYLVMILIFIHGLYLGTDFAGGILRWLWVGIAYLLIFAGSARLWRVKTV